MDIYVERMKRNTEKQFLFFPKHYEKRHIDIPYNDNYNSYDTNYLKCCGMERYLRIKEIRNCPNVMSLLRENDDKNVLFTFC